MSYDKPRIKLDMSLLDVMVELSDGNPGALTVLMQLARQASAIDPDSALGALGPLCSLDTLDCYGSRIWKFYKDVCGQNINTMMGVLRANQMGFIGAADINRAIDVDRMALDIPHLLMKLKTRLPKFATERTPA